MKGQGIPRIRYRRFKVFVDQCYLASLACLVVNPASTAPARLVRASQRPVPPYPGENPTILLCLDR